MPSTVLAQEAEALPPLGAHLPPRTNARIAFLVVFGIFISTFAQDKVIGQYPFNYVLKNMGKNETAISSFFFLAGLAWYFKPVLGIFSDSFPLFGTRRRSYLLLGSLLAAIAWAAYLLVPQAYGPYLLLIILVNAALVLASTVCGGLLVEEGQKASSTGNLSMIRNAVMCGAALIAGPVGGYFAKRPFSYTSIAGAAMCLSLFVVAMLALREPRGAKADASALPDAWAQLKKAFTTRTLLLAVLFTFLVSFAPGFQTPLFFYQSNTLKFSSDFITNNLVVLNNFGGILGSILYGLLCRRLSLRVMIIGSIVLYGVAALGYLHYYTHNQAMAVEFIYGFCQNVAMVMTLDIAALVTPKGSEATAYALLVSAYNIASQFANVVGSWILDHVPHVGFPQLVWINSVTTFLTLLAVPLLPAYVLRYKNGLLAEHDRPASQPPVDPAAWPPSPVT